MCSSSQYLSFGTFPTRDIIFKVKIVEKLKKLPLKKKIPNKKKSSFFRIQSGKIHKKNRTYSHQWYIFSVS